MEEKKKSNNIIIVILVLIIIVALGVIVYMFINQKDDNKKNTTNNNTVVENNVKKDKNKDYTYEANYEHSGVNETYTLENGSLYSLIDYSVPYINIESTDANIANEQIKKIYEDVIKAYKVGDDTKAGPSMKSCTYKTYTNNNILSIIIKTESDYAPVLDKYYSYNIDLNNGKSVSYIDAYKSVNLDENTIKNKINSYEINNLKTIFSNENEISKYVDETIKNYNDSVVNNSIVYYINKDNNLSIIVKESVPAGAGYGFKDIVIK